MNRRAIAAFACLAVLFAALLGSAPALHARLHKADGEHQCAATLFAAGKCDTAAPNVVAPTPVLKRAEHCAMAPQTFVHVAAATSVLEHAPPRAS